jgi:hypothetical protein
MLAKTVDHIDVTSSDRSLRLFRPRYCGSNLHPTVGRAASTQITERVKIVWFKPAVLWARYIQAAQIKTALHMFSQRPGDSPDLP